MEGRCLKCVLHVVWFRDYEIVGNLLFTYLIFRNPQLIDAFSVDGRVWNDVDRWNSQRQSSGMIYRKGFGVFLVVILISMIHSGVFTMRVLGLSFTEVTVMTSPFISTVMSFEATEVATL